MSDGMAWHQAPDFSEELRTYAANRGIDKKPADEAARQLLKDHRELSATLRTRDEKMVRLPETPEEQAEFWQRFGAPKDAAGYTFDGVKLADGTPAPAEITEAMREAAAKHHLSVAAAAEIAAAAIGAVERGQNAAKLTQFAKEKADLDAKWGQNLEKNLGYASIAARIMKVGGVEAFEGAKGYTAIMEGLAEVGSRTGEAPHLQGEGSLGQGALTPATAQGKIAELMKDKAFYVKLTDPKAEGHADAQKLWGDLNRASVAR